jgi:hypothetical protein
LDRCACRQAVSLVNQLNACFSLNPFSWLYGLFLGIDANFRMCRRNKSSEDADPSLSNGWAYFVEQSRFKKVLDEHAGLVQEVSLFFLRLF